MLAYDLALILYLITNIDASVEDWSQERFLGVYIRAYRYELELAIEWYNVFATRIKKFDALALSVDAMYEFLLAGFPGSDDDFTPTYLEHEDIPAARALKTSDLLLYNEDAHHFTKANWLRWREQHIRLRTAYVVMEREEWVDPVIGKTALRPPVPQLLSRDRNSE